MIQFYFLSILLNAVVGSLLVAPTFCDLSKAALSDSIAPLVIGAVSLFVGFVKLLSPIAGVALFGDLIPAATGILGGASIILSHLSAEGKITLDEKFEKLETLFIGGKKVIGFACFAAALLHFLCPNVVLF